MKEIFYSNGKLLITGEYLVLDGGIGFALPTKFGQNMTVNSGDLKTITWKSYDNDGSIWFEDILSFNAIVTKEQYIKNDVKNVLIDILHQAYLLNPDFINSSNGYAVETKLTFPKSWGLGTSSTLINNIAQWVGVDAFKLLKNSFGGSGYDIACAQNNCAITYQWIEDTPIVKKLNFNPDFSNNIFFIYLNQKQNSKTAIHSYFNKKGNINKMIPIVNNFTKAAINALNYKDFAAVLLAHEIELSNILEMQTIQESLFPDFDGTIKSLGAWGGDFVMAISHTNPTHYFHNLGYHTVIPYKDMIL